MYVVSRLCVGIKIIWETLKTSAVQEALNMYICDSEGLTSPPETEVRSAEPVAETSA